VISLRQDKAILEADVFQDKATREADVFQDEATYEADVFQNKGQLPSEPKRKKAKESARLACLTQDNVIVLLTIVSLNGERYRFADILAKACKAGRLFIEK
jgi:hypothetical protein